LEIVLLLLILVPILAGMKSAQAFKNKAKD
jgi:hypothetical protein